MLEERQGKGRREVKGGSECNAELNSRLGGKEGKSCQGPWATFFQMSSPGLNDINQHFTVGFCCPAKSFTREARHSFFFPPLQGCGLGRSYSYLCCSGSKSKEGYF